MQKPIKAKLIEARQNGRNYSGQKEMCAAYSVIASTRAGMVECITCRVYMARSRNAMAVYASIWANGRDVWTAGTGSASGYGYHKESAAIDYAISSAGFKLSRRVDGTGEHEAALLACARALGYSGRLLIVRH